MGIIITASVREWQGLFAFFISTRARVQVDALNDRNLTVHTYEESTAIKVEQAIRQNYAPLLRQLHDFFQAK